MAILSRFLPSSPLAGSIEAFCFYEADVFLPLKKELCLPNGQVAMVINLGHDTVQVSVPPHLGQFGSFHGGVFHGAFSQASMIDPNTMVRTISICFKPGGAHTFLSMPATELTNQAVDLFSIFGTAAIYLCEQLQSARTDDAMVSILERFFLARAAWEQTPHPAIAFALDSFQAGYSISAVTARLGMSPKRFIHLFGEAVGLTPKVFCRVQRFQEVVGRIEKGQTAHWADLALSCGYFDQAHFIHDFQSFSGLTPQAYLEQRGPYRNHVPQS